MLLIPCPYCGSRPELEFRYGGHAHIRRDPTAADDQAWAEFLFVRDNPKGVMAERWRHVSGCGRFFNCLRDTVSDNILVTYRIGEPRPAMPDLPPEGEAPRLGGRRRGKAMSGRFRTKTGGRVDRATPIRFTFDGEPYTGFKGDTLASALLSHGVHLVGRSFKYHRPRGFLAAGSEEPNALVSVARDAARVTPNLRMTQVELYEGLDGTSQNRWPRLGFDVGAINSLFSPLFVAGFYYKTFMGPRFIKGARMWADLFEPIIRRAAGLGEPPRLPDPDLYAQRFAHCDVLVIGAGPAGIAAALSAARAGSRVILCDENSEMGGSLLAAPMTAIDGRPSGAWLAGVLEELAAAQVVLLPRTQAFGYYNHNFVGLCERLTDHRDVVAPGAPRERMWQVRAGHVILATGATERPLVFPDNDRPGIMLADAARTFLNRYGVRPGTRAVVVTAHDSAYRTAMELAAAGVAIARIVDVRPDAPAGLAELARARGIATSAGSTIVAVKGALRVSGVTVGQIAGGSATDFEQVACDLVLMSGGWTPAVHLFSQSRGKLRFDDATQTFVPGTPAQAQSSVGGVQRRVGDRGGAPGGRCGRGSGERTGRTAFLHGRRRRRRGPRRVRGRAAARPRSVARQSFRGLPERCHGQGYQARRAGGLPFHRACEALHHDRDGHRPGQDLEHECARDRGGRAGQDHSRGGPDHLPATLHAGDLRDLRGSFAGRPVRSRPGNAHPCLGGPQRRALRGCRPLEAGALFSADRRRHACGRGAGMPRGSGGRRHFRWLDPGQDRGRRAGRGGVPQSPLHQ